MADRLLRQSLTILEGAELAGRDTRAERAYVLLNQARRAALSDLGEALRLGRESLALYQEVGERWHAATALNLLTETSWYLGAYEETREYFEECAAILRSLGHWGPEAASQFRCLVALAQGRFEEAEHISVPIDLTKEQTGGKYFYPIWLYEIGMVLCLQGNFSEARARLERGVSVSDEMGLRLYSVRTTAWLGLANLHLGMYERAQLQGERALRLARDDGTQWGIGFSLLVLGASALADQRYERARALCQEGAAVAREAGLRHELGWASASLAYAARGLGRPGDARGLLREGMRTAAEAHRFVALMYALAAAALLLLDADETERAVELYALASRHGFVANSRWFEDVAGRHIAATAESLPPEVVAAAHKRGRARDLWETGNELLAELET
jgi:tetratricopeptide (TPR) repeat protein